MGTAPSTSPTGSLAGQVGGIVGGGLTAQRATVPRLLTGNALCGTAHPTSVRVYWPAGTSLTGAQQQLGAALYWLAQLGAGGAVVVSMPHRSLTNEVIGEVRFTARVAYAASKIASDAQREVPSTATRVNGVVRVYAEGAGAALRPLTASEIVLRDALFAPGGTVTATVDDVGGIIRSGAERALESALEAVSWSAKNLLLPIAIAVVAGAAIVYAPVIVPALRKVTP